MLTLNDEERLEYIIPRRIRQGYEFAPGWGTKQVIVLAIGLVAAGMVFLMLRLLGRSIYLPLFVQVLPPVLVAIAGFGTAMPQLDGSTILERIENWRSWSKCQKLYLYDWSRDDF